MNSSYGQTPQALGQTTTVDELPYYKTFFGTRHQGGNRMKKSNLSFFLQTFFLALGLSIFIGGSGVFAMSLEEAKSQGLLGETLSGYLALVKPDASAEAKALMNDINQKRKQKYQEIAKRNGTALSAVEALAGKTAMSKTKPGHYIQLPNNQWERKP